MDAGIGLTCFLWGTTKRTVDKTSLAAWTVERREMGWREDLYRLVRFTLPLECFLTWNEVVSMSDWTPEQVATLVEDDVKRLGADGHARWRLRHDPLRLADVLKVEARTYAGRWKPI